MFKKSFLAIAVLGATTFSAQAFTLPHNNTTNPNADAAAGWMVNDNFSAVNKELNSQQEKIELNKDAIAANKDAISANKDAIDLGKLFKNPCSQAELNKIVPFGFSLQRQKNGVFLPLK